eukprot:TRINITY_DN908_c0_g1_i27.p4 TRINITY_DN908_c0_g1~~TRINITY_DN908_c0_g1_i27.p4  ORF type:complete len:105 (-),score=1.50 TRINITY_DN908_c0_g1_i27:439-753(-)
METDGGGVLVPVGGRLHHLHVAHRILLELQPCNLPQLVAGRARDLGAPEHPLPEGLGVEVGEGRSKSATTVVIPTGLCACPRTAHVHSCPAQHKHTPSCACPRT